MPAVRRHTTSKSCTVGKLWDVSLIGLRPITPKGTGYLFGRKQGKKLTFGKKTQKGPPLKGRALESSFMSYKKILYPIKIGVGMLETEMSLLILA